MKKTNINNYDTNTNSINAKTYNQEKYLKYLKDTAIKILFVVGPAGTGKTYMACSEAITLLKFGLINKIIITRPVVPVEEDIGFLPGNLIKKMDPWTKPIIDVFEEKYSKQEIEKLINNNIIEISPLAYMRGRTFKNAFIIADEMQNSSPNQMLMLTTRIGENSKMIITGDIKQTDKPNASGLNDFLQKFYEYRNKYIKNLYIKDNTTNLNNYTHNFIKTIGIQVIELDNKDIQRSPVVGKILEIYNDKNTYVPYYNKIFINNNNTTNINTNNYKKGNLDAALIPKYLDKFLS